MAMIPTKRLIRNIFIAMVGIWALIGLAQGIWMFHASLSTILVAESIIIGAGVIGAIIGWLVLRAVFPHLRSDGKKSTVSTNIQPNLVDKKMYAEYELSSDDVLSFHLYNYEQSPTLGRALKLIRRISLIAIAVVLFAAVILGTAFDKQYFPLVLVLCAFALIILLYYLFSPSLVRQSIGRVVARDYSQGQDKLTGKHKVSITADSVTDITDMGESTTRWQAVEWIVSTDQHLFMAVRGSGPYIVPRRAFNDDASFRQFVDTAKGYQKAMLGTSNHPASELR
jgi:hypothetical protein